ncbi:hypothetical protein BG011_001002 [Mortierella polycephala]|uniref:Uncharacterized protein n=1 Tax=Mortierella polycephala TaxID=41804 RepID=A0A9P6Q902_9FUNG|nr:hypothetical protein BG011_001002 [Mortierella polycephala]
MPGAGDSDSNSNNNISFSPLPIGRSNPEPQQMRRLHEYTPSPARSLALVLENAQAAETQGHNSRISEDQWVANASDATASSSVHFQSQASPPAQAVGRSGSGSVAWMGTSVPESRFSGFEVVYDDGVRKQRTFSLTTEPDDERDRSSFDDDRSETSPLIEYQEAGPGYGTQGYTQDGAGTHTSNASARPSHTTPHLGNPGISHHLTTASEGQYHPRPYNHNSNNGGNNRNNPFAFLLQYLQGMWLRISQFSLSTPNKRILKASLAYLLGCLVSFTPFFRPYVGLSGHLAATCAVFFNPAKSLGRMVDAVTAGLSAIAFGFLVCVSSMLSAIWFNSRGLYVLGHVMSVIIFGGGSTFAIAFAKAHYNRPTVNVGKYYHG